MAYCRLIQISRSDLFSDLVWGQYLPYLHSPSPLSSFLAFPTAYVMHLPTFASCLTTLTRLTYSTNPHSTHAELIRQPHSSSPNSLPINPPCSPNLNSSPNPDLTQPTSASMIPPSLTCCFSVFAELSLALQVASSQRYSDDRPGFARGTPKTRLFDCRSGRPRPYISR